MLHNYVCHTNYNGKTMLGDSIEIKFGEKLERHDNTLLYGGKPICIYRSLVGKQHFALNDDGQGLERGKLTWTLAYKPRLGESDGPQQRFSNAEIEILTTKWQHFLKPNCDFILFNDEFFEQSPEVLKEITTSLGWG